MKNPNDNTTETTKHFNEAFYLINSGEINEKQTDYLSNIKNNSDYWLEFEHNTGTKADIKKAVELLNNVLDEEPKNEQAYLLRAVAYFELQLFKEASIDYEACVNLNPETPSYFALNGVGMMKLILQSDTSGAIDIFTRVIDLNPEMTNTYFNRAYAYSIENKWQETYNDLIIFLEKKPNEKMAIDLMAKAEKMQGIKGLGESPSNPFDVDMVPEVYQIMHKHFPNYKTQRQSLQYIDGQKYDVIDIVNDLGATKTIYFRYS